MSATRVHSTTDAVLYVAMELSLNKMKKKKRGLGSGSSGGGKARACEAPMKSDAPLSPSPRHPGIREGGEATETAKAPVKAGLESQMKELYRKGVAHHPGPEPCARGREASGEALVGVHAGQSWSSERSQHWCADPLLSRGRLHHPTRSARARDGHRGV